MDDSAQYCASIWSILVDFDSSNEHKCGRLAKLLETLAVHEKRAFQTSTHVFLPSLIHLARIASPSPERLELDAVISRIPQAGFVNRLHEKLITQTSLASSIAQTQHGLEKDWLNCRSEAREALTDASGANMDELKAKEALLDKPLEFADFSSESTHMDEMLSLIATELRRLTILCELQVTTMPQPSWIRKHALPYSSTANSATNGVNAENTPVPVCFDSNILGKPSPILKQAIPLVFASLAHNPTSSTSSMDVDIPITGVDTAGDDKLPSDVCKLVFSLLQNDNGDVLSYHLIMNMFLNLLSLNSSKLSESERLLPSTVMETLCAQLVAYLHLLRFNDPIRGFIPSCQVNGPFYQDSSATSEKKPALKAAPEEILGSGFPRRLSLITRSSPSVSYQHPSEDSLWSIPSRSDSTKPGNTLCYENERQVATRVESLLVFLVKNILIGPEKASLRNGLYQVRQKLLNDLEKYFLCSDLQVLLAFSPVNSTDGGYSSSELTWIHRITSDQDALKRANWIRFFRSNSLISKRLVDRIGTLNESNIGSEGKSALQTVTYLKNWAQVLCSILASFSLSSSSTIAKSLKMAVSKLIALQDQAGIESEVDSAFHFIFCSMALLTLQTDNNYSESFAVFVSTFQVLNQLSSVDSKSVSPSFGLLRLFQQLHLIQRLDLLAEVLCHVLRIPIDMPWLVRGLTLPVTVHLPSSPSASTLSPTTSQFLPSQSRAVQSNSEGEGKTVQVRMSDSWVWASPPTLVAHLTLSTIYSWPTTSFSKDVTTSIVTVFEESELLSSSFSPVFQKIIGHANATDPISTLGSKLTSFSDTSKKSSTWTAKDDPWLPWVLLRLALQLNRTADFQRSVQYSTLGGNFNGVAECLWKMIERVGSFTCSGSLQSTRPIHSIVIDTIQTFVDLVLDGEQKFWDVDRMKTMLSPSLAANFTQCLLIPLKNAHALIGHESQVVCPLSPDNIVQALIFVGITFLRTPLPKSAPITPSTTPFMTAVRLEPGDEFVGSSRMDIDNEPSQEQFLRKSDFLAYMARHYRVSNPTTFLSNVPSSERKRQHAHMLNTIVNEECVVSPSNLLQLCKVLHVETALSLEQYSSGMLLFNQSDAHRKAISMHDLVRKRVFAAFPHLRHFVDLLGNHSRKSIFSITHQQPILLDLEFLGGDYRSLIQNHPFLAHIDFPSLYSHRNLDLFIFESISRLLGPSTSQWDAQCLENVVSWSFRFVSLERTLQIIAFGFLHKAGSNHISRNNLSSAINAMHLKLIGNPQDLMTFHLRLLTYPSLFNHIFYKLISYYFCLSKAEISSVMRLNDHSEVVSGGLDDSQHSDDELSPRHERATSAELSDAISSSDDGESTKPTSSVAALTDPFSLRKIPRSRRRAAAGSGNLRGEKKLTTEDAETLKRLQDCVLVHALIDLMILIEDTPIDVNHPLEQGAKEEIRVGICVFLQSLFVNDAPLMALVHQQGYPSRALPWLTSGVPAMHYCLELAPQLLNHVFPKFTVSDADSQMVSFPVKMTSYTIKRYPTQRSLDLATYILDLYKSCGKSLNFAIWSSTLSDLAIIATTFPSLAPVLMDLILTHEGSHSPNLMSTPSDISSRTPDRKSSLLAASTHSSAQEVLRKVFAQIVQGQAAAPFLRG